MRILAIRGANLASLDGSFAVDLANGPLARAGLFAITGPTGAGKSTILDGLCLALFNTMPRLPRGTGVALGRAEDPHPLLSNDVKTVLRRGAVQGHAEVDFVGRDGIAYRARWEVRRARLKASGKVQEETLTLIELASGRRCGDGKKTTLAEIEARLGLTVEQFKRAVLLAQGDFATFLKAPAAERSQLLELITGTEIYSRLSQAAHQRARAEEEALKLLEAERRGVSTLDPEARTALDAEAAALADSVQAAERVLESARATLLWHEADARLAKAEAETANAAAGSEAAWEEAAPRRDRLAGLRAVLPLRSLVESADRTAAEAAKAADARERSRAAVQAATARLHERAEAVQSAEAARSAAIAQERACQPDLEVAATLDSAIALLSGQQQTAGREAAEASRRAATLATEGEQRERMRVRQLAAAAALTERLERAAAIAPLVPQWQRWDAALNRLEEADARYATAASAAAAHAKDAGAHEARLTALLADRTRAETDSEAAGKGVAALRAEAVPDLDSVRRSRSALDGRRAALHSLAALRTQAVRVAADLARTAEERAAQEAHATAEERHAADAAPQRSAADAACREAEETLRRFHLARSADVAHLRSTLTPDAPCPVCGATAHPWAEDGTPLARLAAEQEERVATLRQAAQALADRLAGHTAAAAAASKRLAALDRDLARLTAELAGFTERWAAGALPLSLPESFDDATAADGLTALSGTVERALADAAADEERAIAHRKRLDEAGEALRTAQERLAQIREAAETARRDAAEARHAEALAGAERDRAAGDGAAVLAELDAPFASLTGWREERAADPAGWRAGLARRVAAFREMEEQRAAALADAEAAAAAGREAAAALQSARDAEATAKDRLTALVGELSGTRTRRAALLDGQSVAEARTALASARESAELAAAAAAEARAAEAAALAAAEAEERLCSDAAGRTAEEAGAAAAALAEAAERHGLDIAALRARLAHDAAWIAAEEAALADLERARDQCRVRLAERQLARAEHAATAPALPAAEAEAARDAAEAQVKEARRRHAETESRRHADDAARARLAAGESAWRAQSERHTLWARLDQVIGSADGKKFRNYAQSLSLDALLVHANRHLAELARRYRLERAAASDLEIQVIDREMADEVRAVHSLSGGEMFLVSLALALGLSAMAAGGGGSAIGTLFIDEGFGTLDPDSLDLALSCLEALQAGGRQVGVISHVPTLVERIGVQVRVTPQGGGRSTVRVVAGGPGTVISDRRA